MSDPTIVVNVDAKAVPPGGYVIASFPEDVEPPFIQEVIAQARDRYPDLRIIFFAGGIEVDVVRDAS